MDPLADRIVRVMSRIAGGLEATATLDELYRAFQTELDWLLGPSAWTVLYQDPRAGLVFERTTWEPPDPLRAGPIPREQEPLRQALEGGEPWRATNGAFPLSAGGSTVPVVAAFPLDFKGERYAVLLLHRAGRELDSALWPLLQHLVQLFGSVFVHRQLSDEGQARLELAHKKLVALTDMGEVLRNLDLDVLLAKILDKALDVVQAEVGSILLAGEGGKLESRREMGLPGEIALALKTAGGELLAGAVLQSGETWLVTDAEHDPRVDFRGLEVKIDSLLAFPLASRERKLGVLLILNTGGEASFSASNLELLTTIGGMAGIAIENALLVQTEKAAARAREQLSIAKKIQQGLLPKTAPEVPGLEICGWSLACDETGGDYYDYRKLPGDKLALVIGDASGHGLGSALFMTTARATLLTLLGVVGSLSEVLQRMNNFLEEDMGGEKFMTLFFGVLDPAQRTLAYASAGHDAPFLFRSATGEFLDLESTGLPLGMIQDSEFPTTDPLPLEGGDVIVLGTDGIWEAMNPANEEFGRERLKELIRDHAGAGAQPLLARIREAVRAFMAGREQRDDHTLVVVRVAP